jgi:hypothetical protein
MSYWSCSPSSNNDIASSGYSSAFQADRLYTGAVAEGRAHLKYSIMIRWISKSARYQEVLLEEIIQLEVYFCAQNMWHAITFQNKI